MAFTMEQLQVFLSTAFKNLTTDLANYTTLFPREYVPEGMGIEEFVQLCVTDRLKAAFGRKGIEANLVSLDASKMSVYIGQAKMKIKLPKEILERWVSFGPAALSTLIKKFGEGVIETINDVAFNGYASDESSVSLGFAGTYNWLLEPGDTTGTLSRPLAVVQGSSGAWATAGKLEADIAALIGDLEAIDADIGNTLVLYPRAAGKGMRKRRSAAGDATKESALTMLRDEGIAGIVPIDTRFFKTQAAGTPAIGAFDLLAVDKNSVFTVWEIEPRVNAYYLPNGEDMEMEAVANFAFVCEPNVDADGGIRKKVSIVTAINGA